MLKFSRKVEYAIIAITHMAEKPEGELSTAKELAEKFAIPSELMGKVLQLLARQNLIVSEQGVKGGYKVIKPLAAISLKEVLWAVSGPVQLVSCVDDDDDCQCDQLSVCNIKGPMEMIHLKLHEFFEQFTLADFIDNPANGIPVSLLMPPENSPAPTAN